MWLEKGAVAGSSVAVNSLAFCYEYGIGLAQDKQKAKVLYEIAANKGSASACHNLALSLPNTRTPEAKLYLKRAEDLSVKDADKIGDLIKY